jgi:hypothetical protein
LSKKEAFRSYNDYYNNTEEKTYIDRYLIPNITKIIQNIHSKNQMNLKEFLSTGNVRENYTKFLYYLDFNLSSSFKECIKTYLKSLGYTVNLPLKLIEIYIETTSGPKDSCLFYFKCDITFDSINSSLPFYTLLKVNNIERYIKSGEYTHNSVDPNDMSILFIENLDNKDYSSNIKPSKSYIYDTDKIDSLYRTKNTLYLLDPFYTSASKI